MDAMGFLVKETRRCLSAKNLYFNRSRHLKLIEPTYFPYKNKASLIQLEKIQVCPLLHVCSMYAQSVPKVTSLVRVNA